MFSAAIIVFRESLEAALLIGIIAAATRDLPRRTSWLLLGIAAGILGSIVVALLTERIATMADGAGQEIFNATILGVAVAMLGWHHVWMATHGKEMAAKAKAIGASVRSGTQEKSAIAVAIALTVLREGSETALFMQSLLASTPSDTGTLATGGILGLVAGAGVGLITYRGLMHIPLKAFFSVTGALLVLLASGLASQMAKFLIQVDLLPTLASPLWDTSWLLPATSGVGTVLHVLLGYEDRPTGMQVMFYVATLITILTAAFLVKTRQQQLQPSSTKLNSI